MTSPLEDQPGHPVRHQLQHQRRWRLEIVVGGAGVVTVAQGPNGIAVATFSAGTAAITGMPPTPAGNPGSSTGKACLAPYMIYSPAATVTECIITAVDWAAGTATIRTSKAGTATTPASGDVIVLEFEGECK